MIDELIPREIDRTKLKKPALSILATCDKYIDVINQQPSRPDVIKIYPKKYKILAENLKQTGQNIRTDGYRGYRLERYADV